MDGGREDNSCLPSDFWMSQSDPHYSGHQGNSSLGDARSINAPAHEDPSRKQAPLYDTYGVPGLHYKQSSAGRTTSVMQPFTTASNRSAWEFAAENLCSSPKDLTSQSFSPYTTNAASKFSQSSNDFAPENLSQSSGTLTPHNFSQPLANYSNQSLPQTVRDLTTQGISQPSTSDRSVWAHFSSLDPSISSYGVNTPTNLITSYSHGKTLPYSHAQGRDAFQHAQSSVSGSTILPQKPSLISSRELMAPFFDPSSLPSERISATTFVSSGYSDVISTSKQSQPVNYEERLDGYSPVSPPTRDIASPFSTSVNTQNGDSVLKSDSLSVSSDFSYNNSSTSSGQILHSDSNFLPMSLDVPLDMSKAWSLPDAENVPSVSSDNNAPLSLPVRSDVSSLEFSKQTSQSSDVPVINQFGNNSQKVAPKKSNFYGRDASSIFSLPENLTGSSYLGPSDKTSTINSSESKSDVKMVASSSQVNSDYNVPQVSSIAQSQNTVIPMNETFVEDFDSLEPSFADSFIDASTTQCSYGEENNQYITNELVHQTDKNHAIDGKDINELDYVETDLLQSQVKAVREKKHAAVASKDISVLYKVSGQIDENSNNSLNSQDESLVNLEGDQSNVFVQPANVGSFHGKAPRGRRKRGGGAQRRQGKKGKNQAAAIVGDLSQSEIPGETGLDTVRGVGDVGNGVYSAQSAPKPKATRGRKRKAIAPKDTNPDDDTSSTRRSSNRRSKDNAMRLIELQAESINHTAKPVADEPQPPARVRRKAAKAAMKNTFDESIDEEYLTQRKDSSSEEISDEKDADYAVDDDDVAALEIDEILDVSPNQKKSIGEKKAGGLKISIKLSSDSSAEIVSGFDKSPPRKKRKALKKKEGKTKVKSKAIIQDDDEEDKTEEIIPPKSTSEVESVFDKKIDEGDVCTETEQKPDIVNKHNSLMDKYFSSANTATFAQQSPKSGPLKKEKKMKLESGIKSKAKKNVKNLASKDSSVNSSLPKLSIQDRDTNATSDKGVPKFVCGYCPNRYHDKHTLLSHMEAHMAEMEEKEDKKSGGSISKEPKKLETTALAKKVDSKKHSLSQQTIKKSETPEEPGYNCGECGKNFPSKSKLLDHVRTHTAEKPFECNLCHKCFKERNQLSAHRKVHIQEGLIRCPICSKGFVNNADLTAHMESHPKRSKPAQGFTQNKSLAMESAKKSGKLHHVISSDKEPVTSKPKSFASALEPQADHSTLLLRRNDINMSLSKEEATNSKNVKPTKSVINVPKKDEIVKKQPFNDKVYESKVTKPDQKSKSSSEVAAKLEVKTEDDKNSSAECNCKECPECVTRFLQSFL